jgi:hypothetical protein
VKPIDHFEKKALQMLERWGAEMKEGGQDNVLEMADAIRDTSGNKGGWPPRGAGMFSPLAAEADLLLHEMYQLDRSATEYLTAYAFQLSLTDMVRAMGVKNRTKANAELRESLSKWVMAVYYRSRDAKELWGEIEKQRLTA